MGMQMGSCKGGRCHYHYGEECLREHVGG
jgi:hypothetical protein